MAKNKPAAFRTLPKDQRRERIIWAAKSMFLEKGFDAANMDDVAARAGTTKPTVYAHFATKEALFAAVVELVRGLYLGKLKEPSAYAADPAEAVARFCARFLELASCQVAVGFQRMALATAGHSPELTRAVYDTVYGEACRALARYLKERKLCRSSEREAHLLLSATAGAAVIGYLYGVDDPPLDLPDEDRIGRHIDCAAIYAVVKRLSAGWRA
jgi:AcrR family transcriptional regulator